MFRRSKIAFGIAILYEIICKMILYSYPNMDELNRIYLLTGTIILFGIALLFSYLDSRKYGYNSQKLDRYDILWFGALVGMVFADAFEGVMLLIVLLVTMICILLYIVLWCKRKEYHLE